jgi:hypothetical protein
MEYYDYKETFNYGNGTSTPQQDEIIIVAVASSMGGICLFILFCCCCTAGFAGWVDNCINSNLSGGDEEYGQIALRRVEEAEEKKKENPEERKKKLLSSFERNCVTMVVTEHSFVRNQNIIAKGCEPQTDSTTASSTSSSDGDDESTSSHDDECDNSEVKNDVKVLNVSSVLSDIESGEVKELYLPSSSKSDSKNQQKRTIPNCCAICLCPYDVDDTVIWSCNKECSHAFHDECIIPWLVKNQNGECPCCRRAFTDLPSPDGGNNKDNNPSFWSIGSWFTRLRYSFVSQRE